jgi:catechol 2,3-dioxygenase-like lactoylglutathione lyase family enzyme
MDGKMTFVYMPVRDMKKALAYYRDQLGFDEAWREGDRTVVFKLPGSETELMLDLNEAEATSGPMFIIPSVDEFYAAQQGKLDFVNAPVDIRPGRLVTMRDPFGNMLYFVDMSKTG